jgi:transcription factor TGA
MLQLRKEPQANLVSTSGGHRENWGESTMAEASPRTDTSTDDTDDKNQRVMSLVLVINLIIAV